MSPDQTLPVPVPLPTAGGKIPGDGPLPPNQPFSFGAGPDNAAGLRLVHRRDGDVIRATVTLDERYQGTTGLAHGGIVAALLDDTLGTVLQVLRQRGVTAQLDVSYLAPVVIGHELEVEAWLASFEGRKIRLVGRVLDGALPVAIGRALFLTVDREHFERAGAPASEEPRIGM